MTNFKRYAIYYAPEAGPLTDFAASWLGWDAGTGQSRQFPDIPLPVPVEALTARPRKYGFHGTLKPPFRLNKNTTGHGLSNALATLAESMAPVTLDGFEVSRLGRFLALTPTGCQAGLVSIAARCVRELDPFRAPPTETELKKRLKARLTDQQRVYLTEWGYPYVMESFRFHMTLTGPIAKDHIDVVQESLNKIIAPLLPNPFRISQICLFGEDNAGRFHILQRHKLTGSLPNGKNP